LKQPALAESTSTVTLANGLGLPRTEHERMLALLRPLQESAEGQSMLRRLYDRCQELKQLAGNQTKTAARLLAGSGLGPLISVIQGEELLASYDDLWRWLVCSVRIKTLEYWPAAAAEQDFVVIGDYIVIDNDRSLLHSS
jgi:hypothetical protein